MGAKDFSLKGILESSDLGFCVSNLDTAPQVEMIDIDLIDGNEKNFYELRDLKPLADSIAMDGLQQFPLVITSPDDPKRVQLISGHRRCAAIRMLVEDETNPREDLRLVPCVRKTYPSPAMAELQLILANSTARVLTSAEIMKQAERVEMLLYELKEQGHDFPGRMRDHVAEACQVSASKLARLNVIKQNLCSEAASMFSQGELNESCAYKLAQASIETQEKVLESTNDPKKLTDWKISSRIGYLKNLSEIECEGGPCHNADRMFKLKCSEGKMYSYMQCAENSKCCKDCDALYTCSAACDVFKDKIKKHKAKEKDKKQQAKNAEETEKLNRIAKYNQQWLREGLARAKAGVGFADVQNTMRRIGCYGFPQEKDLIKYEECNCDDGYCACFLDNHESITELAKLLKCSADYLLGLSPCMEVYAGEWRRAEDPPENGTYVWVQDKAGCLKPSVYFRDKFMEYEERSTGNYELPGIMWWMPIAPLPEGRKFNGEAIIRSMCVEKMEMRK